MSAEPSETRAAFRGWYANLKPMKRYGGRPAKGTVAAALVILEHLRTERDLNLAAHLTEGGAQIAGLNPSSLGKILQRFGETRPFPSEAGRTNRGNNRVIELLLKALDDSEFDSFVQEMRISLINDFQRELVDSLDAYYRLEGIGFEFDKSKPARMIVAEILAEAQKRNQSGPVAQHLVGAKLALRFPHIEIANFPYSAADDQAGRAGDFQIGDTAFHVTVAPNLGHIRKCQANLRQGLLAYLLVSDAKLGTARGLLDSENLHTRVVAESVESFVGQNLSELSEFTPTQCIAKLRELLTEYNRRITEAETDDSLLIVLPAALGESTG